MLVAHYIGNHAKDSTAARLGWAITRFTQAGPFSPVTHCEAVHTQHSDGEVTIVSASLRDGGVRAKRARLNPERWMIVDCPTWDVAKSRDFFLQTVGAGYDLRGALATRLPGKQDNARWFCNEWVGSPYLPASATFGPHQFCAVTMAVGTNVTEAFFKARATEHGASDAR